MPELLNLQDSLSRPRQPMSPLWSSNVEICPSHVDELDKKIAKKNVSENKLDAASKRTCICSPTNHAGSFRCHLHRTMPPQQQQWQRDDGGDDREVTGLVKLDLPMYNFANNKLPQLSRFGRASVARFSQM